MTTLELATQVLSNIFDNGRIKETKEQAEFEAEVKNEAEFEAQELGASPEQVIEIVEFCLNHSSL
jgi:hypothetical protein